MSIAKRVNYLGLAALISMLSVSAHSAFAASTTTTLTVTQAGSAVTTILSGTTVALTAVVKAGSTPVTPGTVNFCDATAAFCTDIHLLGTAQLTSAGSATAYIRPGVGPHSYKAVFVGTRTNAGSASPAAALTVTQSGKIATFTTIAQSGVAAGYTLTATVAQAGIASSSAPTGIVSFLNETDGNALLGTATPGPLASALSYQHKSGLAFAKDFPELLADFNGDGIPDLVTFSEENTAGLSQLGIWLGNGDGTFQPPTQTYSIGDSVFATGDFNGDGKLDLLVASNSSASASTIFFGNGDGTLTAGPALPPIDYGVGQLLVADFNGDGNLDFIELNELTENGLAPDLVLVGDGKGNFTSDSSLSLDADRSSLQIADFNGDGKSDLAFTDYEDASLHVLLGNGDATFKALPLVATRDVLGAVADFNDDGYPDLALFDYNLDGTTGIAALLGVGDGTFTRVITTVGSKNEDLGNVVVGDFNGDGHPDLAFADLEYVPGTGLTAYSLKTLLGNGDGSFTLAESLATLFQEAAGTTFLQSADLNGDGLSDVLYINTGNNNGTAYLALNQSAAAAITGVVVPPSSGTDLAKASYSGDSKHSYSASGTTALAARTISVSPSSLGFTGTPIGDTSPYQQVTVTNTSASALHIFSIQIDSRSFYSWGIREQTCGSTLAAGASCTFSVEFRPTSGGPLKGFVNIKTDSSGTLQQVSLLGIATFIGYQRLDVSPSSLAFPLTTVGEASGYQTISIENLGFVSLNFESIAVTNTTDFYSWGIRDNNCLSALPLYAGCSFKVIFRPTHTGPITADIRIKYNGSGSPKLIHVSGSGK